MARKEIKFYAINKLIQATEKDSLYVVKGSSENAFRLYVTDVEGNLVPLNTVNGSIDSITSSDSSITITGTSNKNLIVSPALQNLIYTALQSGNNISELTNDLGYITLVDVPPFIAGDYDLNDFKNLSADPFARLSEVTGLPTGGTAGQVLSKIDGSDYNVEWGTPISTVSSHAITHTDGTDDIQNATSTQKGLLTQVDWNTFNDKQDQIPGKSLSTNDYTNVDKLKLDSLSNYTGFRGAQSSLANVIASYPTGTLGDWAIITNPTGNAYFAIWDTDISAWVEAGQSPTIPGTNLSYTILGNVLTITSDTGNDVTIPLATTTTAGLQSKEDKIKIDGIASNATNFTTLDVLATLLTGISFATGGAIISTDSILIAFGKIQKNLTDIYTALTLKQDATVVRTGDAILFDKTAIYNSFTSPTLSQLSSSLTGAKLGIIQKIYIKTATFSAPSGWVIQGTGVFTPNVVNIIYAEWADATTARVEYWIELAKV